MIKRVLFIAPQPFFQWRGSPIRVNFTVRALANLGFAVDLLTLPIGERIEMEGINIIRVANPFQIRQIQIGPSFGKFFFDFLLLIKGLYLVWKTKYSIIHGVEEAGMIAAILSRMAGGKAIFEKHSDPFSYKKGFLKNSLLTVYSQLERLTVKHVQAIICTGPGLVEQVKRMKTSTPVFLISDIPSSFLEPSPEQVDKIRAGLQQSKDEILITFVGSFAQYQGIDLLMNAIPHVVHSCQKARFVIIGGKESEIAKWKTVFEKQNILDKVNFLGMVSPNDLPGILSASDILLSPRITGVNTPLKLLDYLKAGRPIVATNVQANRLILNENISVFAETEPKSFAAAITYLIENPIKRKMMGDEARKLYESDYNFNIFTGKLKECYELVIN